MGDLCINHERGNDTEYPKKDELLTVRKLHIIMNIIMIDGT